MRTLGPRARETEKREERRRRSDADRRSRADYPMKRARMWTEGGYSVRKMITSRFIRGEISRWIYAVFLSASTIPVLKLISRNLDIFCGTRTHRNGARQSGLGNEGIQGYEIVRDKREMKK